LKLCGMMLSGLVGCLVDVKVMVRLVIMMVVGVGPSCGGVLLRGRQAGGVRAPRRAGSLVSVSAMPSSLRPLCSAWARAELRGACDHSPPTALEGGNAGRESMEGGMLTGPTLVRGRDRMLCMHIVGGMWCWVGELAGLRGCHRVSRAVGDHVTTICSRKQMGAAGRRRSV